MTSIKFRALTHNDHKLFFEALGEHGKDFQNIQQYMIQKGNKNKSEQGSKNLEQHERKDQDKKEDDKKREQIRNFYNKLYNKLVQLIGKPDDRVEKVTHELYLLINYGEIWKKYGFIFNNKTKRLLEDLVYQGSAALRFKTKNVRLRTPPCRALKKINEIGVFEKVKVVTTRELPKDVIVEFRPATNRDWLKIQSISQNPRIRAKLSIQKRLSSILDYLEHKWHISPDKLNQTVDSWLKLDSKQPISHDDPISQQLQPNHTSNVNGNSNSSFHSKHIYNNNNNNNQIVETNYGLFNNLSSDIGKPLGDIHRRIRLKPSTHHELKEVNVTRVVPDNHLDLSLTAYIKRMGDTKKPTISESIDQSPTKLGLGVNEPINGHLEHTPCEAANSRLSVSLTTPDCSILFERSCTSDQPSIAQARKHLNLLQSLTGALDGCENSRTAYDDTQDRSLHSILNHLNNSNHSSGATHKTVGFSLQHSEGFGSGKQQTAVITSTLTTTISKPTILVNNDIPALHDEDAALPITSQLTLNEVTGATSLHQPAGPQAQSEFDLPKNVTLGDYFKMKNPDNTSDGDNVMNADETANDAFPVVTNKPETEDSQIKTQNDDDQSSLKDTGPAGVPDHVVEIKKLAEGWTRLDDASMTIGELYLALNCPEKITLEYAIEKFTYCAQAVDPLRPQISDDGVSFPQASNCKALNIQQIYESPSDDRLIFKLLTAASISLAQIERQKHDQLQQQQPCSKLKRRKVGPAAQGNNSMTPHDIETTNQRVEEALKQLQPTRLCSYRRAR